MPVARVENQPMGRATAPASGVPEGDHAGVAHDEIERQREEPVDEEVGQERELVARRHPWGDRERRERRRGQRPRWAHSGSPNRPQGLKIRMVPMTAYMMTIAVSGR